MTLFKGKHFHVHSVTIHTKHKNEKMTHLAKSRLPVKRRYFLRTNQLFCFRFDIDKVIRQTYTHTCMHSCTPIYRDVHTCLHTCMNSYIKTSHPLSHRPKTMGK